MADSKEKRLGHGLVTSELFQSVSGVFFRNIRENIRVISLARFRSRLARWRQFSPHHSASFR